jgi:hypothetical protein
MNKETVLRIFGDVGWEAPEQVILDFAARLEAEWMKDAEPVAWKMKGVPAFQTSDPHDADWMPLYLHPAIPEGMVLVPKEPTEAMLLALKDGASDVEDEQDCKLTVFDYIRIEYKAMLAAAQGEK